MSMWYHFTVSEIYPSGACDIHVSPSSEEDMKQQKGLRCVFSDLYDYPAQGCIWAGYAKSNNGMTVGDYVELVLTGGERDVNGEILQFRSTPPFLE